MYKMRIRLVVMHKYDMPLNPSLEHTKKMNIPHEHFR